MMAIQWDDGQTTKNLNKHLSNIEIQDGEVTLLIANAIAQAIYTQWNVDGNEWYTQFWVMVF